MLAQKGTGFVPAHGSGRNHILLCGEAPGADEAQLGLPFVGASGFYLDRVLKRAGLDRSAYRVDNVLHCQPPGNWLVGAPWQVDAIQHCTHFLQDTLRTMRPKVIVALGNTALEHLTTYTGIHRYRGRVIAQAGDAGGWIVPSYHPAFLLPRKGQVNTSRFVGAVIRDLRTANRIAIDGFERRHRTYQEDHQPDEFWMFIHAFEAALEKNPDLYLSLDIETQRKLKQAAKEEELSTTDDAGEDEEAEEGEELPLAEPILRISFSYQIGHAISVPFQAPWLAGVRRLLASPARKVVWNGSRFDVPLLTAHGFPVAGEIFDFMWGWHVFQSDLPKGLEYVSSFYTDVLPWKHLAEAEPAWYNAVDADVALEIAYGVERDLREAKQWDIFLKHIVRLDPLLLAVGNQGVHIDIDAQNALKRTLEAEQERLLAHAQTLVPDHVRPTQRYKRRPDLPGRSFRPVRLTGAAKFCTHCGAQTSNKSAHQKGKANQCRAAKATLDVRAAEVTEWDEILPFNPNSVKDLTRYALAAKHPLGVNHKTRRPTMDKQHVAKLAKRYGEQHPIYQLALTLRTVKKTLGTYVVGFAPDEHGKIYTTYGHHPSTLRLSSRAKNLQNVSHRSTTAYATEVRKTIIPAPGNVFVEADSSAIEAVLVGYFMGNPEYIALAKQGIHDYLTCLECGIEFSKASIAAFKQAGGAAQYAAARDRNKQIVHGTNYCETPYLMHMMYPAIFPTIRTAEEAQARYLAAVPGLAQWHNDIRMFAHKQAYLVNPWGYKHYFYHVYTKDKTGAITLGDDAKRAVAFLPQSSAAAFLKDNVFLIAQTAFWPMPANGLIHDSYCLEVERKRIDEAVEVLTGILTRPVLELQGLTIGCEIKVGETWADMTSIAKFAA